MIVSAYVLVWVGAVVYFAHGRTGSRATGRAASIITLVSLVLLTGGLVGRGLDSGHWPLSNRYEFALCFAWAVLGVYLLLAASSGSREGGFFVLAVVLVVLTYAVTRPADSKAAAPLLPALRSGWLQIHVLGTMVGYGALGVAAGFGLARLIPRPPLETDEDEIERAVERSIDRAVNLGFPWLTFGILSGAIWAKGAWGRYWGWDPKETWALVCWLWYLMILHLRPLSGWRGKRLALLVVAGFGVVLFTFVGVPWLVRVVRLESLHGF